MIWLDLWLFLFGIWPLADPGHSLGDGLLVWLDYGLHLAGLCGVVAWVRRNRHRTLDSLWWWPT